jgi:23S rRNA pseudouridine2605 synthase
LREGKNREIKRVLEHIGLQVNRLIRVSFGPFQLADIVEGAVEEVRTRVLRDQLGPLATKAGADFTSLPHEDEDAQGSRIVLQARPDERPGSRAPRGPMFRNSSPQRETRGSGPDRRREDPGAFRPSKERPRSSPQTERSVSAETRGRPAPGPRKHVSALRAGEGEGHTGGRKRIERAETADRSGRTIHVERLVPAAPQDKERDRPATRNGRRFEAERKAQDGALRSPSRGRDRKAEFAAERRDEAQNGPPRRGQRQARTSAFVGHPSGSDQAQTREPISRALRFRDKPTASRAGREASGDRDDFVERRREAKHQERVAAPGTPDTKSHRPKFSGKPLRSPVARTWEERRGEGDFAPKSDGERAGGRSRPSSQPKRHGPVKGKFGAKEFGGAKRSGRTAGPGDPKTSGRSSAPGRSKAPGRTAKPGTGHPRDKR